MTTTSKSATSTDSSYLENNMLAITRVKLRAQSVKKSTMILALNQLNSKLVEILKISSTINSGLVLISSSMLLIISRLDNMLIFNAFGTRSHCLRVEPSELSAIHRLLSHSSPKAILILLIHQRNQSLSAHSRTSPTKSSTPSNGQEITSREQLLSLLKS